METTPYASLLPLRVAPPTGTGRHRYRYQRPLHTPPMATWVPPQHVDRYKAVFGNPHVNQLNNPHDYYHRYQANTSSGRLLVLPAPNAEYKAWAGNMIQDSQVMNIAPDDTLTGTFAGVFPNQLPPHHWVPINSKDQLGTGRV